MVVLKVVVIYHIRWHPERGNYTTSQRQPSQFRIVIHIPWCPGLGKLVIMGKCVEVEHSPDAPESCHRRRESRQAGRNGENGEEGGL